MSATNFNRREFMQWAAAAGATTLAGCASDGASSGSAGRVVVIGAGFGGLNAVAGLRGAGAEITLIDRRNHHLFQPLLYQVATAGLSAVDIAQPIRAT